MTWPVIWPAAGEARKRTVAATSSTRPAISQRVARAERDGWTRRSRRGDDGRAVLVELTPSGHRVTDRTVDELLVHEQTLLSALTDAQQDQLADLLRILLADLTGRCGFADRP